MLVECPPEYDHVVEVHETVRPLEASQNEVHEPLESRRGVIKSERHDLKLERPVMAHLDPPKLVSPRTYLSKKMDPPELI